MLSIWQVGAADFVNNDSTSKESAPAFGGAVSRTFLEQDIIDKTINNNADIKDILFMTLCN